MFILFGRKVADHHYTIEGDVNRALPTFCSLEGVLERIGLCFNWDSESSYSAGDGTVEVKIKEGIKKYEHIIIDIDDIDGAEMLLNRVRAIEMYAYENSTPNSMAVSQALRNNANITILS